MVSEFPLLVGFKTKTAVSVFLIKASNFRCSSSLDVAKTSPPPNEKYPVSQNITVRSAPAALAPELRGGQQRGWLSGGRRRAGHRWPADDPSVRACCVVGLNGAMIRDLHSALHFPMPKVDT